jgi:cytochrome b561
MAEYSQTFRFSATLRWLHLGLALAVSLELGLGLGLRAAQGSLRDLLAIGHAWLGLLALGLVLLHWLWLKEGHDGGLRRLLPLDRRAWQEVAADLKGLAWRLPPGGARSGLPGLLQGVGLVLLSLQGGLGLVLFLVSSPPGELPGHLAELKSWHQGLGWGVLGYWGIHVGMALVHLWRRDGVVSSMLPWR